MSSEFCAYFAIAGTAWLITLWMVGRKRAMDLSRCVSWYLLVFLLTYLLRPVGTQLLGDTLLYDWLKIGTIEDHWQLMAFAVSLAIICFGLGYRLSEKPDASEPADSSSVTSGIVAADTARKFVWVLLIWGYALFVIGFGTGQTGGDHAGIAGAPTMGEYKHTTAWLMQSDLFVSTGTTLYYILTGDLRTSLLLATPWLMERMLYGWGRNFILGHFFALMGVYFLRAKFNKGAAPKRKHAIYLGLALIVIILLFPIMGTLRELKSQLNLSSTGISKDALLMVNAGFSPEDMVQGYFGTGSDISGFEQSLYHLLTDNRPEWGTQYLYCFFIQPIPRILWPGKGSSYEWPLWLLGIDWNPTVALMGMAPGAIGMAYEQWGWIGIPAEFLFTGWFFGWIEERTRRKTNAAHLQLAYAGFFSCLPMIGRTALLTLIAEKWLFAYGIPVFILWRIYEGEIARVRLSYRRKTSPQALGGLPATSAG